MPGVGATGEQVPDWPFISTPRLRLRPATMDDLPAIGMALADARFPSDLPLARMVRESSLAGWMQRMTFDPANPRIWATTLSDNNTCIGTVALVEEKSSGTCWLSYWLSPAQWHKGLAREAVGALLAGAARHGAHEQVFAAVARSNSPSIRLLKQLEFTEVTGVVAVPGIPDDHLTLSRGLLRQGRDDCPVA